MIPKEYLRVHKYTGIPAVIYVSIKDLYLAGTIIWHYNWQ